MMETMMMQVTMKASGFNLMNTLIHIIYLVKSYNPNSSYSPYKHVIHCIPKAPLKR